MIAVLFAADAVPKHQVRYRQLAGELRPALDNVKGFISIERFQSLSTRGKILSLSWWENEEAVLEWKKTCVIRRRKRGTENNLFPLQNKSRECLA